MDKKIVFLNISLLENSRLLTLSRLFDNLLIILNINIQWFMSELMLQTQVLIKY